MADSPENKRVISRAITSEMKESFIDYAMSVITDRALPDVRDGIKPVHRRILYAMNEIGLSATAKTKKSASVVGEVMGKYHPHGDSSIYEAMVKMAQDFSMRYPMIIGQGNFGCFTKDTKVRLADGRSLSFEELIKEDKKGKQNYTFTINGEGKITIAKIRAPRLTIKGAEIMKIIVDNGEEIECTLNHKFMTRNGEYVEAKDLKPEASLMPIYTRLSTLNDTSIPEMTDYEMILQPNGEWNFTHHLADEYNLSNNVYSKKDGKVRHHADFNKLNNSPENIKRMQWLDHWRLHSNLTASRHKNDPNYVAKLAKGRKEFWDNQENREANSQRLSDRNKKNWQDPEYREKKRTFLKAVNIQYIKDHPEKREELSKRATKTLKNLWQNPEYRSWMHEKIVKGNKNHTTNLTGKKKFDAICKSVLDSGYILSPSQYEKARHTLYPYGAATSWKTGLEKYYSWDLTRIKIEVVSNHKVKKVVFTKKHEDVYDLTIDGTHNFALAADVFVHNSIDGDGAAAMRYTESKMSRIAGEMVKDIDKDTVDFRPNYDGTKQEPVVLPAVVQNLLLNGTLGIAVGMATNIPPHHLGEVVDAIIHLADKCEATT